MAQLRMGRQGPGRSKTPVIRCPYCVEQGNFKVMVADATGAWFTCSRCGHLTLTTNPSFECKCGKCLGLRIS